MMRKLLSMPLTKAYIVTTIVATLPALIFGVVFYTRLSSANGAANKLESAVAGGPAQVEPGAFEAIAFQHNVWFWIGGVLVTFIFAGALIRVVLGNVTIKTVEKMVVDMRASAAGDLRIAPDRTMGNEYGELQYEFGRLVENFRTTISRIDHAARELDRAGAEMAHTSDDAGRAIGEVAQAISAISEGAAHQADLVARSARHIDSIDQSVRDAHEHAEEVRRQSVETGKLADAGVERAIEVEKAMELTRETAHDTAAIVRELGARSADIHLIVQSISDIAAQTNMLALNASIEAARAGDQGRGFANVADEVRVLAEDAQAAVARIGQVIGEIGQQTSGAIDAMESGIARTDESATTVGESRQTFIDISRSIHELGDRSAEINELTREVVNAAARARQHVGEVAVVAEESSTSTEQVSSSTQQTSAASQEVSASAQKVSDTAAALAELSGRFKLPSDAESAADQAAEAA